MPELWVYALASRTAGRIAVRGVMGETLQCVRIGRIDAIVGHVRAIPKPTDSNLRRYGHVISALWRRTPALLPARFGTVARDLADLDAMVRDRERTLRPRLRAVRHRAQMTIRIVRASTPVGRTVSPLDLARGDPEPAEGSGPPGEPGAGAVARPTRTTKQTGTQYLRSRQREYAVPAFDPLRAAVRRWIRDERVEQRAGVATIYHLIPRESADRYQAAIEQAAREAGVRMILSGPWPPYAFADIW